jgi:hypothetical protein
VDILQIQIRSKLNPLCGLVSGECLIMFLPISGLSSFSEVEEPIALKTNVDSPTFSDGMMVKIVMNRICSLTGSLNHDGSKWWQA